MTPFTLEDHYNKYSEVRKGYTRYGKSYTKIVEEYNVDAVKFKRWCAWNKIKLVDDYTNVMTTTEAVSKYIKHVENEEKKIKCHDKVRQYCNRVEKTKLKSLSPEERKEVSARYYKKKQLDNTLKNFNKLYGEDKKLFSNWLYRIHSIALGTLNEEEIGSYVDKYKEYKEIRIGWVKNLKKKPVKTIKKKEKLNAPSNKWKVEYKKQGKSFNDFFDVKTKEEAIRECMNKYNIGNKAIKKVEYV